MSKKVKLFNYKGVEVIFMPDEMNIWMKAPDGVSEHNIYDGEIREPSVPSSAWYIKNGIKVPNLWHEFYRSKLGSHFTSMWDYILIFTLKYEDRSLIDNNGFIKLDETFKMKFIDGGGDIFAVNKLIIYKNEQEVAKWTTDECCIKRLIPVIKRSRLYRELCEKYS